MKDGKVANVRTYLNSLEMLVQVGAMPTPGMKPAASGAPSGGAAPMTTPKASAK